jgi:hypothetical protein
VEPMTQYQCGVDPSEENSGVTSSDEDCTPEEGKETILQVAETNTEPSSIDTNDKSLDETSNVDLPILTETEVVPTTSTNTRFCN